jgi:hypothetical protein
MARKSKSLARRPKKLQPAPLTFTYSAAPIVGGASSRSMIDLSQSASILNRRFYRQGLNWAVAGIKIQADQPLTIFSQKLPNTWSCSNAWHKTFALWNKQLNETLEEGGNESLRARFSDFKVYADVTHRTAGFAGNLLPIDGIGNVAAAGEWDASHVVLPQTAADGSGTLIDPTEFTLHMVGPSNVNSKGMIEGYADSRAFPQSPDPVGPSASSMANNWMSAMFDVGSDNSEILDNAENENDDLPYNQSNYPGGATQLPGLEFSDIASVYSTSATTNIGVAHLKGGNYPCGLMAVLIENHGDAPANIVIQVDLIPGEHRGYLAEPMQEM